MNPFDQFDASPQTSPPPAAGNPFDQFDPQEEKSTWDKYGQPFVDTLSHGLESAGRLGSDSLAFVTGEELPKDPTPATDALKAKRAAGEDSRVDYQRAFLEQMGNSPGGKFLSAVGGIIPEANVVTTALNEWINPALAEATGADESTIALGQMAAAPVAGMAIKSLPSSKGAAVVKGKVTNPIETVGQTVDLATKVAKPLVEPAARAIIENDRLGGLGRDLASETAAEGARLGKKFDVEFSAAELTGNATARAAEDALANSARWGGKFEEANRAKVEKIVDGFNKTLDKIYPESSSRTDVGDRISSAYNDTLSSLVKTRREQAKVDFDAALKGAAGDNYILSNNLFRELQAIKSEGEGKLLTKSNAHAAAVARQLLGRVSSKTEKGNVQADTISLKDMAEGLSNFSAESRPKGGVLDNAQTAAERRVYARLYNALQKDLDAEIASPKGNPERAAMLTVARDNFRTNSNKIADIQKTTLGKIIGSAERNSNGELVVSPERIADTFSKMEPTAIKNTLKFLDDNHPDVANMARRYTLEKALREAMEGQGQRGAGTTKDFAKAEFAKKLPDDQKLNALLKDKSAANDIKDVAAAMNRLTDWGATRKGSQTASRQNWLEAFSGWGKGAFFRAVVDDTLATDLMNPAKRRQIAFEARKVKPEAKP